MIGGRRTEKPESIITGHKTGGEAMEGNTRAETKKPTLRGGKGHFLFEMLQQPIIQMKLHLNCGFFKGYWKDN